MGSVRPWRALALGVCTILTVVGLAGPASAQKWYFTDAARDVARHSCAEGGEPCISEVDPTRVNGDFRTTWVNHTSTEVVVRSHFSALSRPEWGVYQLDVLTNEGRTYDARIYFKAGHPNGVAQIAGSSGLFACNGLRKVVSFADDTIALRIPRTCLSRPASVQLKVSYYRSSGEYRFFDSGFADGWTVGIKRG
jgi:hypothetical protein